MKISKRLNLSVQYATHQPWVPERVEVRRWVRAALEGGAQITVRFVDEDEARTLNHDYRFKDYATNVLSFPYEMEPVVYGDLVIAPEVCAREAAAHGKTLNDHMAHLIVHGVLHLCGYDHNDDAEADTMESRERDILASLNIADPYLSEQQTAR